MKIFIDTSSLFKKYVQEAGSDTFEEVLKKTTEIIISPITWLEVNSVLERRLREKTISEKESKWVEREVKKDLCFFGIVKWNERLEDKAVQLIRKYQLKVFDGVQLASCLIAKTELFLTSDKKLYQSSKKEKVRTQLIG